MKTALFVTPQTIL